VDPLHLDAPTFHWLLAKQGPSLALWRAAEIAALRECAFEPPVLDLGCGDGLVMSRVLPSVDIGIDPDAGVLGRARESGLYRRLEAAAIQDVSLDPGSVGTIVSNSVLEHVGDIDAALAAASRLLRRGGRLILTAPSDTFSSALLVPLPAYSDWVNRRYGHLNLWPAEEWQKHLCEAGLRVERVRPYLSRRLVRLWDVLELAQQIHLGKTRLVSVVWRRIPAAGMQRLARWGAQLDLSACGDPGGRLLVARKV
jgi:SAM-dependent methyltransferase